MAERQRKHKAWHPAPYTLAEAMAMKGLQAGTANDHQQRIALRWIIENLCGTYDQPYDPDSSRDSDFGMGKQFVGQQIVKLLNVPPELLKEKKDDRTKPKPARR